MTWKSWKWQIWHLEGHIFQTLPNAQRTYLRFEWFWNSDYIKLSTHCLQTVIKQSVTKPWKCCCQAVGQVAKLSPTLSLTSFSKSTTLTRQCLVNISQSHIDQVPKHQRTAVSESACEWVTRAGNDCPRPWLSCCFDYFHFDFGWPERIRRLLDLLFQCVPKNNLRIVQQHVLKHTRCIAQKSAVGWVCKSVHRGLLFWSFPSPLASFLSTTAWSTTSSPYIGHGHYNPGGQDVGATILLFRFWSSYSSPSRCPWLSRPSTSFWRSAFPTGLQPNSHLIWSVREYIFHPIFWSNLVF